MATKVNHLLLNNGLAAGIYVQKCRHGKGLTQKQVDEKCGFSPGFTGRLERGELRKISIPDVYELEATLKGFKRSTFENLADAKLEIQSERTDPRQVEAQAISKSKTRPVSTQKQQLKVILKEFRFVLLIAVVIALWSWNSERNHQEQVRIEAAYQTELANYERITNQCLSIEVEEASTMVGEPRTQDRLDAVLSAYDRVYSASCIEIDGNFYWNPFHRVGWPAETSIGTDDLSAKLLDGANFAIDSGIPFFSNGNTLCEDGWVSGSRGQGTCSWHGGYAKPRGFPLSLSVIANGERIEKPYKPE
jgi:transcriptional regulator with XRE-family HTH domain